jgi:uncharacterized protein (TIGR03083 family)
MPELIETLSDPMGAPSDLTEAPSGPVEAPSGPIEALRADRAAVLAVCAGLSPDQWQAPSGCPGWSVKDLISHLGILFWMVVDQTQVPADLAGQPTEQANELAVAARREQAAAEVLADYEKVSELALVQLAGLATLDMEVPLGDLGTYPAAALPLAYCFDHYTHLRADLFAPRGPLTGTPPPSDELREGPALGWIEAALPQQNSAAASACALEIQVTGPAARIMKFGTGGPAATLTSDAPALIRWVTQRGSWAELGVAAVGDEEALAVARTLKVF